MAAKTVIASAHMLETLRRAIVERLPTRVRWLVRETAWDWDFSRAGRPLEPISDAEADVWNDVLPPDWRDLLIFGEEDFAEGGGAKPLLTVHARTGKVFGLDVERESAAYFLSSSIPAFIETFLVFDPVLRAGDELPSDLAGRVRAADPDAFDKSEWRDLVDELVSDP